MILESRDLSAETRSRLLRTSQVRQLRSLRVRKSARKLASEVYDAKLALKVAAYNSCRRAA